MRRHLTTALLVGILFLAGSVQAQRPMGQKMNGKCMAAMDLTDEQQAKITDLRLQMEKEVLPLRNEMDKLRGELRLEMTAEKFNEGKVKKISGEMSTIREKMQLNRMKHQRAVRDLLTPEQQKQFDLQMLSGKGHGGMCGNRMDGNGRGGMMRDKDRPARPWNN
ncbi:MAG: Spy/CpxP family protein refolding chaperone [Calditrichaceae bacterium]